jgi:hypothetical protein
MLILQSFYHNSWKSVPVSFPLNDFTNVGIYSYPD